MSTDLMELKLAELQQRVERLEAREYRPATGGNWREMIGFAKDDDLFREAMERGEALREQANREGH